MGDNLAYDLIIVGAGAAGCVLASRLSECPGSEVLLIEAGPDNLPGAEHPDLRDPFPVSYGNADFFWPGLNAELASSCDEATVVTIPFMQGYGVGGSSNVNGMAADRGQPADYDGWRDGGLPGWGWADVLPYFNKLEQDLDFSGDMHGATGPIPVRRVPPVEWAPLAKAIGNELSRRGHRLIDDYNSDFGDGLASVPMSCLPDRRVSASMAYLTAAVRNRPNLTVLTGARAERLDIADGKVIGIFVEIGGEQRHFRAKETIVSCGAIQSPALLMRSGIGAAHALNKLGITVQRDLPGVGQNLQNHSAVILAMHLPHSSRQAAHQRAWQQNQLRYSSRGENSEPGDMQLIVFNKTSWHPLGKRIGALIVHTLRPYSRGSVALTQRDGCLAPRVTFDLLSDKRDFKRLVEGVRFAFDILLSPTVATARNELFRPNGRIVAYLARRKLWTWLQAWVIARLFDVRLLRRRLLHQATIDMESLAKNEDALAEFVSDTCQPVYHVCGSCRMGPVSDAQTVVDSSCRVVGLRGLRVVDASIFPIIPAGSTHFPALMVAEKMADAIKVELMDCVRLAE